MRSSLSGVSSGVSTAREDCREAVDARAAAVDVLAEARPDRVVRGAMAKRWLGTECPKLIPEQMYAGDLECFEANW